MTVGINYNIGFGYTSEEGRHTYQFTPDKLPVFLDSLYKLISESPLSIEKREDISQLFDDATWTYEKLGDADSNLCQYVVKIPRFMLRVASVEVVDPKVNSYTVTLDENNGLSVLVQRDELPFEIKKDLYVVEK